ncbi:Multiple RNA-binding domain-containing protein 1 [Blastocladiella emersonii ATCC 22665]|nr:Multiple RNA-binding domain-containing protein 1 [Blastocladiella emersonii ATCC 22665]
MGELSRIIVKNLPKYVTPERVREQFSDKGTVTDVKLIKTGNGVFRRFAYVGFKSEREARAAVKHYHNTFVDTARVSVELAKPIGDPSLPRAWSKYTKGSSAYEKSHGGSGDKSGDDASDDDDEEAASAKAAADAELAAKQMAAKKSFVDELYEEEQKRGSLAAYLEVFKPRANKATWQNDDASGDAAVAASSGKKAKAGPKTIVQQVPNRKPGGQGMTVTRSHTVFESDDDDDEYQTIPAGGFKASGDDDEDAEEDAEMDDAADASLSGGDDDAEEREDSQPSSDAEPPEGDAVTDAMDVDEPAPKKSSAAAAAPPAAATAPAVPAGKKVVPWNPEDVEADTKLIEQTGRLFVVNLPYSVTEKDLLELFQPHGALAAVHIPVRRDTKQAKGIAFVQYVDPAHALLAYKRLQSQFYQGRVLHLRGAQAEIARDAPTVNEGSSFKTKRAAQLKATAGKDFNWNSLFMASDAVADAMAARLGVSKAQILDREASDMAVRLALAETHIISETKQFFAEHGVVLDSFNRQLRSDSILLVKNIAHGATEQDLDALVASFGDVGRILLPPSGTVAIVEFLSPADAKAAFRHLAYKRFKSLPLYLEWAPKDCFEVPYDPEKHRRAAPAPAAPAPAAAPADGAAAPAPAAPAAASTDAAPRKGKKRLQSAALMGEDDVDLTKVAGAGDESNTKLIVRNVPFEATIKDLRQLFSSFAHVKHVRLPKKVTGGHRGFAFAEFLTHNEALEAMKTLKHTHLYGRRLVIEFAKREESVDELRERTRAVTGGAANKRAKVDMGEYEERGGAGSDGEDE